MSLGSDFYKSNFSADLQCGEQTCWDMSIAESKICKPFVKQIKNLGQVLVALLIIHASNICCMVCFDIAYMKVMQNRNETSKATLSLLSFVIPFAALIIFLSAGSFNDRLFCAMNINEKICNKQRRYNHEGALHTTKDPIYVSAPCKLLSERYEFKYLGNADVLDIDQDIAPCSFELRSNFFIENFEMSKSASPNDFVLVNGEPLDFVSEMDFHSWSKLGSAMDIYSATDKKSYCF